jgi:phosphoribosylformylglycinamidine (FGAM) synthase-like enzyme
LIVEGERGASAPRWVSDPGSPSNAIGELTHPARYAVPQVDVAVAKRTFAAIHEAISQGLVRACHDPSEGGLAVAVAEMAFAGGLGAHIHLVNVPTSADLLPENSSQFTRDDWNARLLFSESASRFVVEVPPQSRVEFEHIFQKANVPAACIGEVVIADELQVVWALRDNDPAPDWLLIDLPLTALKEAWQKPLRW